MRTSPKTNPVMACDYDDEGLSGSVNPSGSGSGSGVVQEDEEEGERKRKRKTNSGGAKKKDGDDTASLLKRIRASLLRRDIWKLTKKRTWKHKYWELVLDFCPFSYCFIGSTLIYRRPGFRQSTARSDARWCN
jgi:hypothetical protein